MPSVSRSGAHHVIRLGNGRPMPLAAYVAAWEALLALPRDAALKGIPSDPRGDFGPYKPADALREMRGGLDARINRHIPGYGQGRKWRDDWQWDMRRAAGALNSRHVIHWLPKELRKRFADRIADPADYR